MRVHASVPVRVCECACECVSACVSECECERVLTSPGEPHPVFTPFLFPSFVAMAVTAPLSSGGSGPLPDWTWPGDSEHTSGV